jgi:hypothetical protein
VSPGGVAQRNSFFFGFAAFCGLAGWCDTSLIKPSQALSLEQVALEPAVQDEIPSWIGESSRMTEFEPAD